MTVCFLKRMSCLCDCCSYQYLKLIKLCIAIKNLEDPGIDPGASRMLSERSTI